MQADAKEQGKLAKQVYAQADTREIRKLVQIQEMPETRKVARASRFLRCEGGQLTG